MTHACGRTTKLSHFRVLDTFSVYKQSLWGFRKILKRLCWSMCHLKCIMILWQTQKLWKKHWWRKNRRRRNKSLRFLATWNPAGCFIYLLSLWPRASLPSLIWTDLRPSGSLAVGPADRFKTHLRMPRCCLKWGNTRSCSFGSTSH